LSALQSEVHELRLAVAALRAEVVALRALPAALPDTAPLAESDPPSVTLLLPLAWAALKAGVPADGVLPVDLGPDTVDTEIVLAPAAEISLPEAPLLDPRLARAAEALDELMDLPDRPIPAEPQRERETA